MAAVPQTPPKFAAQPQPGVYTIVFTVAEENQPGDYHIQLASNADGNDLMALKPIVEAVKQFIEVGAACPEVA